MRPFEQRGREDAAVALARGDGLDVLDHRAVIGHRVGVGHGANTGHTALGSRTGLALDRALVLVAGLTKMHVHINETGDEILARQLDDLAGIGGEVLPYLDDALAINLDIHDAVETVGGIDDVGTLSRKAIISTSKKQIQSSHADADARIHLVENHERSGWSAI